MGVFIAVKCTHCESTEVIKHGLSSNGKQRYLCLNVQCPYQTFSLKIAYPGRQKHVKQQIIEMTLNGSGVRDIARVLHISPATVIHELKKTSSTQVGELKIVEPPRSRANRGNYRTS